MILGKDVWVEFYDHPDKILALFDKISEAIIRLLKLYKEVVGESLDRALIGPLFMSCGGVKIGNDSLVMLSPKMFRDFVCPSIARIFRAFSGGYHHSCGYYPEHLEILCETTEVTVVNFGEPKFWNMPEIVADLFQAGNIYYGGWERLPGESIEGYLRRGVEICGPQRKRAVLYAKGEGPWPEAAQTMALWHKLQDQMYPN